MSANQEQLIPSPVHSHDFCVNSFYTEYELMFRYSSISDTNRLFRNVLIFRYGSIFDTDRHFLYGSIRIDFSDMVRLDRIGLTGPQIFIILDWIGSTDF